MVDLGAVALGVFTDDGSPAPRPEDDDTDQSQHMVVMKVTTDYGEIGICMARGAFSQLMAHPNEAVAIDCSITMEGAYGRNESE